MKFYKHLIVLCIALSSSLVFTADQSTSGPIPPAHVSAPVEDPRTPSEIKVLDVPAYKWRHGSGPTAVGMVVGYYDLNGYSFISGNASSQLFNPAIDQAIASGGDSEENAWSDNPQHYEDYCRPRDENESSEIDDKSTLGGAHEANCIADFMEASWSSKHNLYGQNMDSLIPDGFKDYVELVQPGLRPRHSFYWKSSLTYIILKVQINAENPMVFFVDTDGDGTPDHFVTAVGYRTIGEQQQYGCYDTWYATVRWCDMNVIADGVPWGVDGGWVYRLDAPQTSAFDVHCLYK